MTNFYPFLELTEGLAGNGLDKSNGVSMCLFGAILVDCIVKAVDCIWNNRISFDIWRFSLHNLILISMKVDLEMTII